MDFVNVCLLRALSRAFELDKSAQLANDNICPQIAIAIWLLWAELGPSVLAGLAVIILMGPINGFVASKQRKYQVK